MDRLPNIHPGEVIQEEFLIPLGMSKYRLAQGLGITPSAVGEILAGRRSVTAATALRLSRFLGCSPEFWMGLQAQYDLEEARRDLGEALDRIQPYPRPDLETEAARALAAQIAHEEAEALARRRQRIDQPSDELVKL
jgi:addiction module HigA family antidote